MYGFFIKKNFFDGWDNMLSLAIVNLLMLAVLTGLLSLMYVARNIVPLVILLIVLSGIILSVLIVAYGDTAARIANFEGAHSIDYLKSIPSSAKDGVLFGILLGVLAVGAYVCIPFYFAQGNLFGVFIGSMFVWLAVFMVLSLQWFVALRSLFHNSFKKTVKKCFLIFFDNIGFSVFMALYDIFLVAMSIVLFGMLPSFAGITLAQVNALRLRLYKYDYFEKYPDLAAAKKRKYIPWNTLLANDIEMLGTRSLKSLIFPWKEIS